MLVIDGSRAALRRAEGGRGDPGEAHEDQHDRDGGVGGDRQPGEPERERAQQVGGDHDPAARHPVGQRAGERRRERGGRQPQERGKADEPRAALGVGPDEQGDDVAPQAHDRADAGELDAAEVAVAEHAPERRERGPALGHAARIRSATRRASLCHFARRCLVGSARVPIADDAGQPRAAPRRAVVGDGRTGQLDILHPLALYAYAEGGTSAVAVALLVRMLPAGLAAPYAAMLADRRSRRSVLLWSAALRAAALLGAAAAAAADASLGVVLVFATLFTVANTAHRPAQAALTPRLARTPSSSPPRTSAGARSSTWASSPAVSRRG